MKKIDMSNFLKEYTIVTIGVILVAAAVQYFFAPNNIAAGGLSGLALIINYYLPNLSIGTIIFL